VLSRGDVSEMAIIDHEVRIGHVRPRRGARAHVDKALFLKKVHEDPSLPSAPSSACATASEMTGSCGAAKKRPSASPSDNPQHVA